MAPDLTIRAMLVPPAQETLDRLTRLAASMADAPVACVSLLVDYRHLLSSSYGWDVRTALLLSYSLSRRVTASGRLLAVADAREHPLEADSPCVREGSVRAFVAMPLIDSKGCPVGTLLAMDSRPRAWTAAQLELLDALCVVMVSQIPIGGALGRGARAGGASLRSARLLLRKTVQRAKAPHQVHRVNAHHRAVGHQLGKDAQRGAVVGVIEGGYQHRRIRDVKVGVARRKALAVVE